MSNPSTFLSQKPHPSVYAFKDCMISVIIVVFVTVQNLSPRKFLL